MHMHVYSASLYQVHADFPIPDSVEPPYIIGTHTAEIFTADCTHHNYVAEL